MRERRGEGAGNSLTARRRGRRRGAGRGAPRANGDRGSGGAKPPGCNEGADGRSPGEFSNRASARPPERSGAWGPRERTAIGGPAGRSPPVVMRERTGEAPVNSLTARQRGRRSGAGRGAPASERR